MEDHAGSGRPPALRACREAKFRASINSRRGLAHPGQIINVRGCDARAGPCA
jgi:hypothetical protein